jgi:hypothetical protein
VSGRFFDGNDRWWITDLYSDGVSPYVSRVDSIHFSNCISVTLYGIPCYPIIPTDKGWPFCSPCLIAVARNLGSCRTCSSPWAQPLVIDPDSLAHERKWFRERKVIGIGHMLEVLHRGWEDEKRLEESTVLCRTPPAAVISFGYPLSGILPLFLKKKQNTITYLSSSLFSTINCTCF